MKKLTRKIVVASLAMGVQSVIAANVADSTYDLKAVIYDTDASLHGAFTCSPYWSQTIENTDATDYNACYYEDAKFPITEDGETVIPCNGITQGMVNNTLTKNADGTKKMTLTAVGKKCFGKKPDEAFAAMFKPTAGVNEAYCVDIPLKHTKDDMWEFNSDYHINAGTSVKGGFYPGEKSPKDADMLSERLPIAESKRAAEGPTFFCTDNTPNSKKPDGLRSIDPVEGVPVSDLICNGPGWVGGINCDGLFAHGSEFGLGSSVTVVGRAIQKLFDVAWIADGWGWSCDNMAPDGWDYYKAGSDSVISKTDNELSISSRWVSGDSDSEILTKGGRNQHYCLETHATFTYEKGRHFSFNGNDDMWVFINNKLAVDLGGTHLPAPGYVDLDKFMGAEAIVGEAYDLDIYFCSRRTTMTGNIRIKTDLDLRDSSGLSSKIVKKEKGIEQYEIIYKKSSDACSIARGINPDSNFISGKTINYFIENASNVVVMSSSKMKNSSIYLNGGIDITDRTKPKINRNVIGGLPSGTYNLVAEVEGHTLRFQFKIVYALDVADKNAVVLDEDGSEIDRYGITKTVLIGDTIPIYVSYVKDDIDNELIFETSSAANVDYSLSVKNENGGSEGLTILYCAEKNKKGMCEKYLPVSDTLTVGESGVDTLYATFPFELMKTPEHKFEVNVLGGTRTLSLTFLAPVLAFVDGLYSSDVVYGDATNYERKIGEPFELYLIALMPIKNDAYALCTECNFLLSVGSETSSGITVDADSDFRIENGRATIKVRSTKEYRKGKKGAELHIVGLNPVIEAKYFPIHFKEFTDAIENKGYTIVSHGFRVDRSSPLSFMIVLDESATSATKSYAVLDMLGKVVESGEINAQTTYVSVPHVGSYIVKVGKNYQRIEVK